MDISPAGNIYVADNENGAIRKITPQGKVTTLTALSYATIAVAVQNDRDVYYSVENSYLVWKYDQVTGKTTKMVESEREIVAISIYNNMLYMSGVNILQSMNLTDTWVTTAAGTEDTNYGMGGDGYLAVGAPIVPNLVTFSNGSIWVADLRHRVRKILPKGYILTVFSDEVGPFLDGIRARDTRFRPAALIITPNLEILVSDPENNAIRRIANDGTISAIQPKRETILSGASAFLLQKVRSMALTDRFLLTVTSSSGYLNKLEDGIGTMIAGPMTTSRLINNASSQAITLESPSTMAIQPSAVFICDTNNHRIVKVMDGVATTIAGTGIYG